jgi:hypothetical protein
MDMTNKESTNPNEEWLHECWNCAATEITNAPVKTGVPYWLLRRIGKYFVDNELFEKNLHEDLDAGFDALDDEPWNDEV